jgi:hypothetical protein
MLRFAQIGQRLGGGYAREEEGENVAAFALTAAWG